MHLAAHGTAHGINSFLLQTIDRVGNAMLLPVHTVLILVSAIAHNDCSSVEFLGLHSRRYLHRLVIYLMSLRRTRKPFSQNVRGEHLATLAPVRVVLVRGDGENRRPAEKQCVICLSRGVPNSVRTVVFPRSEKRR